MKRHAVALETVRVRVPEHALEAFEGALLTGCGTVGFFLDEDTATWTVEGVRDQGADIAALEGAVALAGLVTGVAVVLEREETPAEGWLARTYAAFPEQLVGRRFAIRGTHLTGKAAPGRLVLTLDAGVAFGSGEHGSTRGCLRALEGVAYRRPRRILDLGTGSGVLAMAAARLLRRPVTASDIDPWSVRVAGENARLNGLGRLVRPVRADGWGSPTMTRGAPYDLIFANILARPLCAMARETALHLAPGGTLILAGLLAAQRNWVLASYRRQGLRLERVLREGAWATLVLRKSAGCKNDGCKSDGGRTCR
jgi:ribosomal protein L11 methyltransferase